MNGVEVELRGISVDYGARRVVDTVDLLIKPGELVCLLGPNGAGKSTLLRTVTGTLRPATGTVLIDGIPLPEHDRSALARRMAVVPGEATVAFPIRVEELVALGRIPYEHPLLGARAADRAAVAQAVERVGIGHLVGRDVRELSLGERQLVVFAMTIAQGARLLLLDEPTVHLDLRHQVQIMELLGDLASREGITVLAVLHDLALAGHFAQRLILMDGGRVVADGTREEVLEPSRVRAVYGVDPSIFLGQR